MAKVTLKNVSKIYDNKVVAVNAVSLSINDGEFMVIVGPSGCGKTTALRMIAGLEEISSGEISIDDKVVNDIPPKDRDIAMVFQNYALYPHMSVFDNMAFGLKLRKFPKADIKARVLQAAKLLGIEPYLDRKPKALSGGQRQRVAVGRAIVRNPKAFLFDEPLSNLDAKLRVTTRAELKALHHRLATTSIYVTHDQAEAMTLGDRICVMYNGEVQQVASPLDVYDRPVNRFVAGFLGTPPMNFFEGQIEFKRERPYLVSGTDSIGLPERLKGVLAKYDKQQLVLGVRPEGLTIKPLEGQTDNVIAATVLVVEPLGDHIDVYFKAASNPRFIANLEPHTRLKTDDQTQLYINLDKIHLFEPGETGKNIISKN